MLSQIFSKIIIPVLISCGKDIFKAAPEKFRELADWWQGKNIAIIGPTASGKNSMFSRLKRESPPPEHIQTRGAEKVGSFKFKWLVDGEKVEFNCRKSINVGGEIDERERNWADACKDADAIFYLVDIKNLLSDKDTTIARIRQDFLWLAKNINDFKCGVVIHVLLNKIDEIEFPGNIEDKKQYLLNEIEGESTLIQELAKKILGPRGDLIVGISPISMADDFLFDQFFVGALKKVFLKVEGR